MNIFRVSQWSRRNGLGKHSKLVNREGESTIMPFCVDGKAPKIIRAQIEKEATYYICACFVRPCYFMDKTTPIKLPLWCLREYDPCLGGGA
jgi:hypothetical protein